MDTRGDRERQPHRCRIDQSHQQGRHQGRQPNSQRAATVDRPLAFDSNPSRQRDRSHRDPQHHDREPAGRGHHHRGDSDRGGRPPQPPPADFIPIHPGHLIRHRGDRQHPPHQQRPRQRVRQRESSRRSAVEQTTLETHPGRRPRRGIEPRPGNHRIGVFPIFSPQLREVKHVLPGGDDRVQPDPQQNHRRHPMAKPSIRFAVLTQVRSEADHRRHDRRRPDPIPRFGDTRRTATDGSPAERRNDHQDDHRPRRRDRSGRGRRKSTVRIRRPKDDQGQRRQRPRGVRQRTA